MTSQTTEKAFEDAIIDSLITNGGYKLGNAAYFSRELAFDKATLLQFIQTSQPDAWHKLSDIHGADVEPKFIQRLYAELEFRGMLDVLRYGITDYGVRFKLACFKPASGLNPDTLYSMRQAIEEGFIMDVLQTYTTYKTYFRLTKAIEDDPEIHKKKANRAIARFLSLHPHNLAQKTEVMIEHFFQCVMPKIGGKAKAMIVTASRPHVVRYKDEFDKYLQKQGYTNVKALVAFTAFTDRETGIQYTESDINGFGERELPEKFETVEYQLLIVADKYQTGFDQPLLHTM